MNRLRQVARIIRDAKVDIQKTEAKGIISIRLDDGVHVSFNDFMDAFKDFKVTERNDSQYPYKVNKLVLGVNIYAIASREQFKNAFPDAKTPQELYIEELEAKIAQMGGIPDDSSKTGQ